MEVFNIIAGICSIIGLGVSIFTASTVIKIKKNVLVNSNNKTNKISKNKIIKNKIGDGNNIVGGDEL